MSDSLIGSFLVSNLSNSLTIAHFLWATWANCSWSLIFGERPERFAHIAHIWWVTWAIYSHRSPKKRKWAIHSFFNNFYLFKSYIKHIKNKILDFLAKFFWLSNLSESLMVAHLSWATWAIGSCSLISSERPERFAHGLSFVLSDLSESLTVAHLNWAKWANERISSPVTNADNARNVAWKIWIKWK